MNWRVATFLQSNLSAFYSNRGVEGFVMVLTANCGFKTDLLKMTNKTKLELCHHTVFSTVKNENLDPWQKLEVKMDIKCIRAEIECNNL